MEAVLTTFVVVNITALAAGLGLLIGFIKALKSNKEDGTDNEEQHCKD